MTRAEWTNTLPNVGTGAIKLGTQRDLGVITDYFPISDGSYSVPPEGFYSTEGTWYDEYLTRRKNEFVQARNATTNGSAENKRLYAYIEHLYSMEHYRRWRSPNAKRIWVEWHTYKHYPSYEAWKAEKEQERANEERKLIPLLFGLTLKRRREWYNNNIYRQLYTPEEREALALRDAGRETAERIAEFEREYKQQYSKTE